MAAKNPGLVDGWLWLLRIPSGDWRIVTDRLYLAEELALQAAREWKAENRPVEEQREPA